MSSVLCIPPHGKGDLERLTDDETNALSMELGPLTRLQFEALLNSPYLRMSKSDADAWDRRRVRIGAISDCLAKVREQLP